MMFVAWPVSDAAATPDTPFSISSGSNSVVLENTNSGNLSGEAIAFRNSDSSIALRTDGAERARLDSSGNLLVGKTSNAAGDVGVIARPEGQVLGTADSTYVAVFSRNTDDGEIVRLRKGGSTIGNIGTNSADLYVGTGDATVLFSDSANAVLPRGTEGVARDGGVDLGNSANRWKNVYTSSGIYLGGTGSANHLDDYEEGTWTPVVADAATGGNTATYTTNVGRYRKVGNMITVSVKLVDIDTTGMTAGNAMYIRGLPFTAGSGDNGQQQGALFINGANVDAACVSMCVHTSSSQSYLLIREIRDNQGSVVTNVGKLSSGTADIFATITYFN